MEDVRASEDADPSLAMCENITRTAPISLVKPECPHSGQGKVAASSWLTLCSDTAEHAGQR